MELATAPDWLINELEKKAPKKRRDRSPKRSANATRTAPKRAKPAPDKSAHLELVSKALRRVADGAPRNETGFWLCCQWRDAGVPRELASDTIRSYALMLAANGDHLYTEQEALASLEQAYENGTPREPRYQTYPLTDSGNAERLIDEHGHSLRFLTGLGAWLIWNGRFWERDVQGTIYQLAKSTVRQAAEGVSQEATRKFLKSSENRGRLSAMVVLAATEAGVAVLPEALDKNPYLLNVENGTIDLKTGEFLRHEPQHLITKIAPVRSDPDADCPRWRAFLLEIMNGSEEMVRFLQRAIGYSACGAPTEQVLFFMFGTGANGKSTMIETIGGVLGPYFQKAPTGMLMERSASTIPNDVARLRGARFVVASEIEAGSRLNESLVKDLTGGDRLVARFLHQEFFEFTPTHTLWMYGNNEPVIHGRDDGIWRRILKIPFAYTVPDGSRDPDLLSKLLEEAPGIVNWIVQGSRFYHEHGLCPPDAVNLATETYKESSDPIRTFLEERCRIEVGLTTGAQELYNGYKDYCTLTGEQFCPMREFRRLMQQNGFESHRVSSGIVWCGIGLLKVKSEPDDLFL